MDNHSHKKMKNILTFTFLNVDISLHAMQALNLKLYSCIVNIAAEGTVSQIVYICPN